jgi:ABC-type uncharacterized transport system YnjBCD permease subunit
MFVFYALANQNSAYEFIAITLASSTCFLLLVYGFIFRYYNKITYSKNKYFYLTLIIVLMVLVIIFGIRLLSGEDNWICQKGQWVKHGNPDFAAPQAECK